jgi:hypothetical protein
MAGKASGLVRRQWTKAHTDANSVARLIAQRIMLDKPENMPPE